MKIHKKVLNHYLSCTSPVDKEGYLYKMVGILIQIHLKTTRLMNVFFFFIV